MMTNIRKIASIILGIAAVVAAVPTALLLLSIIADQDPTARGYGTMMAIPALGITGILCLAALAVRPRGPVTCPHCGKEVS